MKPTYYLITALMSFCALASCASKDDTHPQVSEGEKSLSKELLFEEKLDAWYHPQRSKSEVLDIARGLSQAFPRLRALSNDAIRLDYVLQSELPRSLVEERLALADTALYIVNFGASEGYAIISGDKRIPELLAASDKGEIDVSREKSVNGLDVFLSRLPIFCELSILEYEQELDSLENLLNGSLRGGWQGVRNKPKRKTKKQFVDEYTEWSDVDNTPNLVPVRWGQGYPYNNEAPLIAEKRAATGCVSVALAQLLSYHRHPSTWQDLVLDWELLTKENKTWSEVDEFNTVVAKLMRKVGDRLGNSWGAEETSAPTSRIPEILKELGYKEYSSYIEYDKDKTISSIAQRKPVVLSGSAEHYTYERGWWIFSKTYDGYRKGHAWIADGLLNQERVRTVRRIATGEIVSTHRETRTLIHCNWGWNGFCNGYFLPDVFDHYKRERSDEEMLRSDRESYFQYNIKNILYVTP